MSTKASAYNSCPSSSSLTAIGPRVAEADCNLIVGVWVGAGPGSAGPDAARTYTCQSTLTITPATPFATVSSGSAASVYLPSAGSLSAAVAPAGVRLGVTGSGARPASSTAVAGGSKATKAGKTTKGRRPAFLPVHVTAAAAGPITVPLKLRSDLAKQIKHRKAVHLVLALTFTPAGGGAVTHSAQAITLTPPPPKTLRLPKRKGRWGADRWAHRDWSGRG